MGRCAFCQFSTKSNLFASVYLSLFKEFNSGFARFNLCVYQSLKYACCIGLIMS